MAKYILRLLVLISVLAILAQATSAVVMGSANAVKTVTPSPAPLPVAPLYTVTPNPDGSIVHVVGPGQALWSIAIAYGVKIADILKLNNLNPNTQVVYAGQKLTIRKANPATETPNATATQPAATRSPTPSRIPSTATLVPTETIAPILTPTLIPTSWISSLVPQGAQGQKVMGFGIIAVCVLGLVVVGFTGFRKK